MNDSKGNSRGIGDSLAWLGGANNDVLDQVPHERARFIQMAIVLLTTASIAVLSMMFALNDGVHVPFPVAVTGGLFWGFVILNLDRFLVLSMGHTRNWKRLLLMALPRLALAAVISLVVATPMTLRIFANDINNEMAQQQAVESKLVAKQQQQTGPALQAGQIAAQITTDKSILAGNMQGAVGSPALTYAKNQVSTLTPQVQAAQTTMDLAYEKWQCERDGIGCQGSSHLIGDGPQATTDQMIYEQDKSKYDTLNAQLQTAQQQLTAAQSASQKLSGQTLAQQQATAKADLPGLEVQYNNLEAQLRKNEAGAQNAVQNNDGILAQLQDLSAAGAKNPMLGVAQWVVTLLFFCIEILPVMVKVLLNIGPLSTYEVLLKNQEDMITDAAKLKRITRRRDAERESEKQIAIDEDMREREKDLGIRANKHVVKHMEAILDVALAEWSRQVQAKLNVQLPPGTQPGTLPGTHPGTQPGTLPGGPPGTGALGGYGAHGSRGLTGPQPRLSITGPQPTLNGGHNGHNGPSGVNGNNGSNGYLPTVTWTTPPGGGYPLPDDADGDLL
jgi:hypothetical protein